MRHVLIVATILLFATSIQSIQSMETGDSAGVQVTVYADGILLEADRFDVELQVTIAGPATARHMQRYPTSDPVFIDINNMDGQPLADGLYKYEAWPIPAITYTREDSSAMTERNSPDSVTVPKVFAVSGTFRITNGLIDDPGLIENDAVALQGASE